MKNYLAVDLGAESGRVMLGTISGTSLVLEELHRFPNTPVRLPTGLYWDSLRLFHEIQQGLTVAGRERKLAIDGIGVDTWGVDFGLLGRDGALVDNPRHYRDSRNNGMLERTFAVVPREQVFAHTGIQFMQLNSLYQLYAIKLAGSPALEVAERLLFMPDLFNYWLSGAQVSELSIASTSQFYNPREKRWATELFARLGLPEKILADIVPPGTLLGGLLPHVAEATGLGVTPVYATCGHDTASAVAAVPASGDDWVYISSGTWSLMGVELDAPVINEGSLALNFTNEIGVNGSVRFLKNIAGLWLLQECRRAWALEGREFSYARIGRDGFAGATLLRGDRSGCVPRAGRHAGEDRGLLPFPRPGPSGGPGRDEPHDSGEPGAALPAGAREPRVAAGTQAQGDPHRRGRLAQPGAQPVRGGRDRTHRDGRPLGSHGFGQRAGAVPRLGRVREPGRGAPVDRPLVPAGRCRAAARRGLGPQRFA